MILIYKSSRKNGFLTLTGVFLTLMLFGISSVTAQMSPDTRKFIQNLPNKERTAFKNMNREERRRFLKKYVPNVQKINPGSGIKRDLARQADTADIQHDQIEGYVPSELISEDVLLMAGKIKRDRSKRRVFMERAVSIQKARGVIETGLEPDFIDGASCPEIDSEKWAIDYSHKRPWPALHKGIDIPQPRGTPILAVSDGTVVGKFQNEGNRKGIEIVIRHTPRQTGLPFWTYSQYTHLLAMSPLRIGQKVKMGQTVGKTSNTGKMGRRIRRNALHFAIFYADNPKWSRSGRFVVPFDGYFMDPNAFYRQSGPYDSTSMEDLPPENKRVPIGYKKLNGSVIPPGTKRIWPYAC